MRVSGQPLAVTMRTPGDDMDLMAGFLVTEGVIFRRMDLVGMRYCEGKDSAGSQTYNIIDATMRQRYAQSPVNKLPIRALVTSSACGLCGKASIDAVEVVSPYDLKNDSVLVEAEWLAALPDRLRQAQTLFDKTGGIHAAALFDPRADSLLAVREDVGRHNAVDKVIGWALRADKLPLTGTVLLVSGRASFEIVQKASMGGIAVVAAVSAPTSLAVDLARRIGLTLVGFLRGKSMVVYSADERVASRG